MKKGNRTYNFSVRIEEQLFKRANFARQELKLKWPEVIEYKMAELIDILYRKNSSDIKKGKNK